MPEPADINAGHVTTSIDQGIGTIEFFHPKGNSLPGAILAQLADSVRSFGTDPNVKAIILRSGGSGPFCGGASFAELQAVRDKVMGKKFFSGFANLIIAMKDAPKFIICRVHGKAVGGGVGVTAASDYALATNSAAVKLSELTVGIGPFVVGPVIEKKIGTGAFAAMSVDAEWRDAEWARQHGLYAATYATMDALDAAVGQIATKLASCNPEAMALLKRVFWEGTNDWGALLAARAEMSGTLVLSEFTKRAIGLSAGR